MIARAFALVAAVALVAGCGGSPGRGGATEPAPPPPDPREAACGDYGQQVEPFLGRFNAALDRYEAHHSGAGDSGARADAVRDLADFLHREVAPLRQVVVQDRSLATAHGALVASLDELVGALEQQATGLALDDRDLRIRSLKRRSAAWNEWSRAFTVIVDRCGDASPGS